MRTAAFHFHRMMIPMLPALLMLCGANRYMEKFLISQHSWLSLSVSSPAINHYKCIFNIICNDELIINIRKIEKQSVNGIGGPAIFTEVGDHPLLKECFINREQTVNLLSAYQARLNGFMSRISNDNLKITLIDKDANLVLVFHEDANDHLYKCQANIILTMVKKQWSCTNESYLRCIAKVQSTT